MTVRFGTENVSDKQEYLLSLVRVVEVHAQPEVVADYLTRVFRGREVQRGTESLHTDWIQLYREHRTRIIENLAAIANPRVRAGIQKVFDARCGPDAEVLRIDPEQEKLSFLLGAGASSPPPSDIPTVGKLLPDLLRRARQQDRPDLTSLADFCDENEIENIEDLLTAVQISRHCSRRPEILKLVGKLLGGSLGPKSGSQYESAVAFLQESLEILFGLLFSRMLPAKPNGAHEAIAAYAGRHPGTRIVTTNYDCCMDRALKQVDIEPWTGVSFFKQGMQNYSDQEDTTLIKLHGSLDWFYCETCQTVYRLEIERMVEDYEHDVGLYPVIGICRACDGQRKPLVVAPVALKFDVWPPLNPLQERAADAFHSSQIITVVGFSFADADLYISRMLTKALQKDTDSKVVIFDPDFNLVERVRQKFQNRIGDFDPRRVLGVMGDCAETLPDFLSGKMREVVEPAPTARPRPTEDMAPDIHEIA